MVRVLLYFCGSAGEADREARLAGQSNGNDAMSGVEFTPHDCIPDGRDIPKGREDLAAAQTLTFIMLFRIKPPYDIFD